MSTKDNGGPAFPGVTIPVPGTPPNFRQTVTGGGMTLRDYLAVHASDYDVMEQGNVMRSKSEIGILPDGWRTKARYMHADAMLTERGSAE